MGRTAPTEARVSLPEADRRQLDEAGYVRLPGFIAPERRRRLVERIDALFAAEGAQAGAEFRQEPGARRLANLVDKGEVFVECIVDPTVLGYVGHVLGPRFKLSSLNARSANPHSAESQPLHVDAGALPDERGYWVCNTLWMLDDFTTENGALRVVPGSHRWGRRPQDVLADPQPAASRRGAGHRPRRRRRGDELPPLARRHREPHRPPPAGAARLLLPVGQAAAAVPEGAAAAGDAGRALARPRAPCSPSTIPPTTP